MVKDENDLQSAQTFRPDFGGGSFVNVAVVFDRDSSPPQVRYYLNGIQRNTVGNLPYIDLTGFSSFDNTEPFRIGGAGSNSNNLEGILDEVRVFNRALPDSEISHIAQFTPHVYSGFE